jgi:Uma2 family endonuclease
VDIEPQGRPAECYPPGVSTAVEDPRTIAHPTLENGAVMTREEFHRLYEECPDLRRVELIEGVVYLPSPIKIEGHAREHRLVLAWLDHFAGDRTDIEYAPPGSILLDDANEPEPDAMLYRLREGRFRDGYLVGAPELIFEVANTSHSRDLHQKKRAYERNGVREYIVWRTQDRAIDWFELVDGVYIARKPDNDGIIESREFPGLRLDVPAMLAHDRRKVLAALRS